MTQARRVVSTVAVLIMALSTPGARQNPRDVVEPSVGFPFRITSETESTVGPSTWFVVLRLSERFYARENLERIWRYFCRKYPDQSQKLDLRIYVDRSPQPKSALGQARDESQEGFAANFLRQGEGYVAGGGNNEILIYHPDLDTPKYLERIVLKGTDPFNPYAYTGHPDSDFVVAAAKGDKSRFELLLRQGVNIDARSRFQDTALTEASLSGNIDLVRILLAKKADVNAKNENGWTALICAASQGHDEIVQLLLAKGADLNATNRIGMSALSRAIYDGQVNTFKLLLERGAEIELKDEFGDTPLLLALAGHPEIARLLLDRGADVNAQRKDGATALILVQSEEWLNALLNKGAKPNARDAGGSTPLMYAARTGNLPKVKILLASGADVNIKNNRGETALGIARRLSNQPEVIRHLIQAGAKE